VSALLHDVARASLPVAIALLVLTAAARAVLWLRIDELEGVARQYLEALGTWCLIAVATYTLSASAAGDAGALSLAVSLALGAAAVLLRSAPAPSPRAEPQKPPAVVAAPESAPARPLWQESAEGDARPRTGLGSR
jgi:hypothetical protein